MDQKLNKCVDLLETLVQRQTGPMIGRQLPTVLVSPTEDLNVLTSAGSTRKS